MQSSSLTLVLIIFLREAYASNSNDHVWCADTAYTNLQLKQHIEQNSNRLDNQKKTLNSQEKMVSNQEKIVSDQSQVIQNMGKKIEDLEKQNDVLNSQEKMLNKLEKIVSDQSQLIQNMGKKIEDLGKQNEWLTKATKNLAIRSGNLHNARFDNGLYYAKDDWDLKPEYAIDGIINYQDKYHGWAHSLTPYKPTFLANLKRPCSVSEIILYTDREGYSAYPDRYESLQAFIDDKKCTRLAAFDSASYMQKKVVEMKWKCDRNNVGREVKISNTNQYTNIAELEVNCY